MRTAEQRLADVAENDRQFAVRTKTHAALNDLVDDLSRYIRQAGMELYDNLSAEQREKHGLASGDRPAMAAKLLMLTVLRVKPSDDMFRRYGTASIELTLRSLLRAAKRMQ